MKITTTLLLVITVFGVFGCKQEEQVMTTIKAELLKKWSVSDSEFVNLLDFNTISEFDDFQYAKGNLFDSIPVALPVAGYPIAVLPEGNKLKNDLLCIMPLPEDRIIRFQFTGSGDGLLYDGKQIRPEESKEIVITRLLQARRPNQQLISLVFEDSIKGDFVSLAAYWINEGFLSFICGKVSPGSTILSIDSLEQSTKENLERYRLIFGIGRVLNAAGYLDEAYLHQTILKKGIRDSVFVFGKWNEDNGTEIHLEYLGILKTPEKNYKILNSCWLWGISKRATNRLFVFDESNTYLGSYYLTTRCHLPDRLEGDAIIFFRSNCNDCEPKSITKLSFRSGIPESFFLECKDAKGDFYTFDDGPL